MFVGMQGKFHKRHLKDSICVILKDSISKFLKIMILQINHL